MQLFINCFSAACIVSLRENIPTSFHICDGKKLEVDDDFVYLGSTLSRSNTLDEEIDARIAKHFEAYGKHEPRLLSESNITIATKISVHQACVLVVLYPRHSCR